MQLLRVDELTSPGSRRTHRGRRKRPANYQGMKAKGKLSEAGKKLENLKRALDKLSAHQW